MKVIIKFFHFIPLNCILQPNKLADDPEKVLDTKENKIAKRNIW